MASDRASRIRDAVACGEFQKAETLWNEYAAQLRGEIRHGVFSTARLQEAREIVEWSRGVTLCARAHTKNRLNSLLVAAEYGALPPSQRRRIVQVSF